MILVIIGGVFLSAFASLSSITCFILRHYFITTLLVAFSSVSLFILPVSVSLSHYTTLSGDGDEPLHSANRQKSGKLELNNKTTDIHSHFGKIGKQRKDRSIHFWMICMFLNDLTTYYHFAPHLQRDCRMYTVTELCLVVSVMFVIRTHRPPVVNVNNVLPQRTIISQTTDT